jgi:hypothetical protein
LQLFVNMPCQSRQGRHNPLVLEEERGYYQTLFFKLKRESLCEQ